MAPSALPPSETSYVSSDIASYVGYAYVHWYVGNAKQAAAYYTTRMGFETVAYRGLETGSKAVASHVVRNGNVVFVLTSPLRPANYVGAEVTEEDAQLLRELHEHQSAHGDAVKGMCSPHLTRELSLIMTKMLHSTSTVLISSLIAPYATEPKSSRNRTASLTIRVKSGSRLSKHTATRSIL